MHDFYHTQKKNTQTYTQPHTDKKKKKNKLYQKFGRNQNEDYDDLSF